MHYMTSIDVSSHYCNLLLGQESSYLTIVSCQLCRYRFIRLLFRVALTGDMFQHKIDDIFKDIPNVFDTADDILIVGHEADARGHDKILRQVI